MRSMKLAVLCVGLMMIIVGSTAVITAAEAGETKVINSKESGTFASTNFDFDNPALSSPANYRNGEGIGNAGKFTDQAVNELAPVVPPTSCTVPGGVAGAGTEFTLVGDVGVVRFTATGDLLFFKATSNTACEDFSTLPTPPFPFILTETGVLTGGTGAYSGATGTFTVNAKGAALSLDVTGVRAFGWFTSTDVLTVTVPKGD